MGPACAALSPGADGVWPKPSLRLGSDLAIPERKEMGKGKKRRDIRLYLIFNN